MAWVALIAAGLLEIGFALSLKASDGFSRLWPSLSFAAFGLGSFLLLSWSLRSLPVGTAYAVWTGIGAAGTALVGIAFLDEPADALRLASIALIVVAVAGLQLTGGGH